LHGAGIEAAADIQGDDPATEHFWIGIVALDALFIASLAGSSSATRGMRRYNWVTGRPWICSVAAIPIA
jgi:hypothetical protein